MEWLAEAQEDSPIVIRVPACPMYPLLLQQKGVQPRHFPAAMLQRIPYWGRGCAAGMPMGYVMVTCNGEVNACMLLQINLGNVRERSIISIWENSPALAELWEREQLQAGVGTAPAN
jgi:MoaA/NifB/PqqE/SkfB family radical SAM enzyme